MLFLERGDSTPAKADMLFERGDSTPAEADMFFEQKTFNTIKNTAVLAEKRLVPAIASSESATKNLGYDLFELCR